MTTPATFKIAPSQRIYLLVIGGLLTGLRVIDGDLVFAAVLALAFLFGYVGQGTFRTDVTASGIAKSGWLTRTESFAWTDLTAIEESSLIGTKSVRISTTAHKRVRLPAPVNGFMAPDSEFSDKLELIRRTWREQAPDGPPSVSA